MNNPLRILQTLDRHLTQPTEITVFGRAALALGFNDPPPTFAVTHDVDAILSMEWLAARDDNVDFWQAQQRTNAELEPEGLYITHLFRESEIILTPEWLDKRARLSLGLGRLSVFRPSALDLVLTKMMRGDEDDLADICFLLSQERLTSEQLQTAFSRARVPDVPEIRQLFQSAQPKVIEIARRLRSQA
ncbi:MAG: hypothetical protein FJ398_15865 [Verrucomicrobia bacterium]|nr:hypothetical protein [Verrucomicrobiota bacterium]